MIGLEELLQLAITLCRGSATEGNCRSARSLSNLFRRIISGVAPKIDCDEGARLGRVADSRCRRILKSETPRVGPGHVLVGRGMRFLSEESDKRGHGPSDWLTSVAATAAAGPRGRALIRLHQGSTGSTSLRAPRSRGSARRCGRDWQRWSTFRRPCSDRRLLSMLPHPENRRPLCGASRLPPAARLPPACRYIARRFLAFLRPKTCSAAAALVDVTRAQWRGDR